MVRAAALTLALGACGGASAPSSTTTTTVATTITTFGGIPGAAQRMACEQSAATLQQASDFYVATHGSPAPSMEALVTDGHVQSAPSTSDGYVIGYDPRTGKVSATGACTYP